METLDHKIKPKYGKMILFAFILTMGFACGLVGCIGKASKENLKNSVNYNGMDYVLQENIGLNFDGYRDYYDGLGNMCEKIGSYRQADVYKIKGLEQKDWILLDNKSMLSSDNPTGGIYLSSKVEMGTIANFKPDSLIINDLTPPTSKQSGTEKQIYNTSDMKVIEKIVTAIENGKRVPTEKQAEVTKAMVEGNHGYQNYRLEFFSESYPKLTYRFSYAEDQNGKYYMGFLENIDSYKIIEVDYTIHEYLSVKHD